jgi:hypothetical protein
MRKNGHNGNGRDLTPEELAHQEELRRLRHEVNTKWHELNSSLMSLVGKYERSDEEAKSKFKVVPQLDAEGLTWQVGVTKDKSQHLYLFAVNTFRSVLMVYNSKEQVNSYYNPEKLIPHLDFLIQEVSWQFAQFRQRAEVPVS